MTPEQTIELYKRKTQLLEMAMQLNAEMLAVNEQIKKLEAEKSINLKDNPASNSPAETPKE